MFVTLACDEKYANKIDKCIAFDGQGFSNMFLEKYAKQISERGEKIKNYALDRDFVHPLMKQIPGFDVMRICEGFGVTSPAQFHSPNSFFKRNDDGTISLDEKGNPEFVKGTEPDGIKHIHGFTTYMMDNYSKEEIQKVVDVLAPAVGDGLGKANPLKALGGVCLHKKEMSEIKEMIKAYGKENNLSRADLNAFLETFAVGAGAAKAVGTAEYVLDRMDDGKRVKESAKESIKNFVERVNEKVDMAEGEFNKFCKKVEAKVTELKEYTSAAIKDTIEFSKEAFVYLGEKFVDKTTEFVADNMKDIGKGMENFGEGLKNTGEKLKNAGEKVDDNQNMKFDPFKSEFNQEFYSERRKDIGDTKKLVKNSDLDNAKGEKQDDNVKPHVKRGR
jgi:hypothetical protein